MNIEVGEVYLDKHGDKMEVISIDSYTQSTVEFVDYDYRCSVLKVNIHKGKVKNKMRPTVKGVGFVGDGCYPSCYRDKETGKWCTHPFYKRWVLMFDRVYGPKSDTTSYKNTSICKDWHNYQKFAAWCEVNYKEDCHLDKDLKNIGNNEYSPDNCEFIPQELNNIIYPKRKETGNLKMGLYKRRNGYLCSVSLGGKKKWTSHQMESQEEAYELYKIVKESYIQKRAWIHYKLNNISRELYNSLCTLDLDIFYIKGEHDG